MATKKKALPNEDAVGRVQKYLEDCNDFHSEIIEKTEKNYRAYRAIVELTADAAQWTSKMYPPYIMHIVETTLASLIDDKLRFKIRPRVTMDQAGDEVAGELARAGAEAHQILMDWQLRQTKFTDIQRPLMLQNAIASLSPAKTFWTTKEERRRRLVTEMVPLLNEQGEQIVNPWTGKIIEMPTLKEVTETITVYDGPITEVRDIHDFMWHPAAPSIDKARFVIDRIWMPMEEVEEMYEAGKFGPDRGGWTLDQVKDTLGTSPEYKDEYESRWDSMKSRDHTKDMVEVIECWDTIHKCVVTLINRIALVAYKEKFPFWHEKPPFAIAQTQSDLFKVTGISQVEKVEALQSMLWDVANQRLDNLRLINNAIFFFRPDIEDIGSYTFEPGARWPVEDPKQVEMWTPNVMPAEVSLGSEALIKGDLQTLAGGFPFASGAESMTIDQKTATGASIVSSLAQRSIDLAKQQAYKAIQEIGMQRLLLTQQFVRAPQVVPVLGLDNVEEIKTIWPEILQGDFSFEIEPIPDAVMKQQEQASAQGLLTLMAQVVPIQAQLASQGMATMVNMDAFIEDTLKAFGKEDLQRYFKKGAPAQPPGQPGGAPSPTPPGQEPQGVTGENLPGSQTGLAPMDNLQQAMAMSR